MPKKCTQSGPCCGVNYYPVLNKYYFKVPAESPKCSVEESMGEEGFASGGGLT